MKPLIWQSLKILLWVSFTIIFLLVCSGVFFWYKLQNENFQRKVADALEKQLPHPFNHNVNIGKIGGRLPGAFLISEIDLNLPSGDRVLLDKITLKWDWTELFKRRFVLRELNVRSFHVFLSQSHTGKWLPDLQQPAKDPIHPPLEEDSSAEISLPQIDIQLDKIRIDDLMVQAKSGNASWQQFNFSLPHLTLEGNLKIQPTHLAGNLHLNKSVQLKLDQHPELELNFGANLNLRDHDWGLTVSPLTLETPKSRVQLELTLNDPTPILDRIKSPQSWLVAGNLDVKINTILLAKGEIKPLIEEEINLNDIHAGGYLKYTPGNFSSNILLRTGKNTLGWVSEAKVDPIAIDLHNHNTQLFWTVQLKDWINAIDGKVEGKTHLTGSLDSIGVDLKLNTRHLKAPEPILDQLHVALKTQIAIKSLLEKSLPTFPSFSGNLKNSKSHFMALNSWLDDHQSHLPKPNLELNISGLKNSGALSKLYLKLMPEKDLFSLDISGKTNSGNELMELETKVSSGPKKFFLSIESIRINEEIGFPPLPILGSSIDLSKPATVTLLRNSGELYLDDFEIRSLKPMIKSKAKIDLLSRQLELQLDFLEQETLDLIPTGHGLPISKGGHISGSIAAKGALPFPKSIASLSLSGLEVSSSSSNLSLGIESAKIEANLFPQKQQANVHLNLSTNEGLPMKVSAIAPLKLQGQKSLQLGGNISYLVDIGSTQPIDLSVFSSLLPENISSLKGKFGLGMKGELNPNSPKELDLTGKISLTEGGLAVHNPPVDLKNIEMDMLLSPTSVKIQHIKAKQDIGEVLVTGEVFPNAQRGWGSPRWQADLKVTDWPTLHPPLLTRGKLNSQLTVSGNVSQHNIQGNLSFSDLLIFPANSPVSPASQAGRDPNIVFQDNLQDWEDFDQQQETSEPAPDFLKNLNLNISVELGLNNWIRHDMFRGELTGELSATSLLGSNEILPKGNLRLQKAELDFQGNKFNMDEGNITFFGDLMPSIDMTFATEIKSWVIEVILQSPVATEITPELSSSPWLSNSDIISVLLFGKPIHAASEDDANGNVAQDFAAAQGAAMVGKKLGLADKGIDLEDVSSTGGRIRIGRYLHPKVYVSAAKSVGEQDGHQLSVEYLIRRGFKVRTIREEEEPLGLEVEWGKDY